MCVIAYKPTDVNFPTKDTLKTCFANNPDGAGYMFTYCDKVHIAKGFMTFNKFWKSLQSTRKKYGDNLPYVLHFRISTQGGERPDCTHPFPLSDKMDDMRKLRVDTNIGIAHNGIISLTSSGYKSVVTYNDTMKFVTDYLSLIIKGVDYWKDHKTLKLIERLCDSKLAILDRKGHCEMIGDCWTESGGVHYSNTSYLPRAKYVDSISSWWDSYSYRTVKGTNDEEVADDYLSGEDEYDELEAYFNSYLNPNTGKYDFNDCDCPLTFIGDDSYCDMCAHFEHCYGCPTNEYYEMEKYND